MKCFLLVAVLACLWTCSQAVADVLKKLSSTKLNVHLVPHSHDDPGWLKTADQYYSGSNSSIYRASVNYIFNSVVDELRKDRERKFTFCEISFFSRWWHEQDEVMKTSIREMIKSDQLGFVNGGWVMHDEASAHYVSMIDQTTMGHQFLLQELNYRPRVGWQIDPFGHSNTHAWLSSEVGFDALFFGRIDYQDRALRKQQRALEFVWRGSKSQSDAEVFTGAFSDGNYAPPDGFCMDTNCPYCRDDPVVTDPLLSTYNLDYKVQKFIDGILAEQNISRGNNIMLRMGADFVYQNAQAWYRSIDALIKHINEKDPRFNLFYSDPTSYMHARAAETDVVWPSKVDDFFPYSDTAHAFWAGYFTSRPNLKFLERVSSSYLQVMKQIAATPGLAMEGLHQSIAKLTAAVGLINHHDAVTGTSKQHVADDYKKILSAALTDAENTVSRAVGRLHYVAASAEKGVDSSFTVCRMVNESVCDATQQLQVGDSAMVMVYNPLPRADSQQVSVFLSDVVAQSKVGVFVQDLGSANATESQGVFIKSDLIPTSSESPNPSKAPYTLIFTAENIPAMSFAGFRVRILDTSTVRLRKEVQLAKKATKTSPEAASGNDDKITVSNVDLSLTVSNGIVSVSFDKKTGLMSSLTRRDKTIAISNDLRYYKAFGPHVPGFQHVQDDRDPHLKNIVPNEELAKPSVSFQTSGAYIFRPSEANELPGRVCDNRVDACIVELTVVRGSKIVEVHQKFSSWVSQVVRLREDAEAVELEYTVGPIPVDDHIGKEVVTKFETSLNTGGDGQNVFYTDSNSREFMERKYNFRPTWELEVYEPVSGNYYPTSTSMYIKDEAADVQLSLLTDRSLAAASLANGELEMMVHRRLLIDDLRGVEEPLNETDGGIEPYPTWKRIGDGIVITGRQFLLLSPLKDGMKDLRVAMDKIFLPFAKFYSKDRNDVGAFALTAAPRLSSDLPINAHVVSLEKVGPKKLLLRLAHQFAVEEDAELSQPVQVDVAQLLASYKPVSITELTLSANQDKASQQKDKIQWQYSLQNKVIKTDLAARLAGVEGMVVTLNPMQIRTFSVEVAV